MQHLLVTGIPIDRIGSFFIGFFAAQNLWCPVGIYKVGHLGEFSTNVEAVVVTPPRVQLLLFFDRKFDRFFNGCQALHLAQELVFHRLRPNENTFLVLILILPSLLHFSDLSLNLLIHFYVRVFVRVIFNAPDCIVLGKTTFDLANSA
ncbi:MAG TPA: hypothetical protein DCE55_18320 [Planctomycetaceae bacterium]|nr:hypothetical protein [Planctomycetaceae bacterium]